VFHPGYDNEGLFKLIHRFSQKVSRELVDASGKIPGKARDCELIEFRLENYALIKQVAIGSAVGDVVDPEREQIGPVRCRSEE
jgi:hypothetical protein